ncbi:C25 family cysteine peptidase [Gimesia fumaroli]|jgi:hypothetical protein|uniref:Gingipain R2 n=1 Tax=Gimesia fumaroli TaxID=2527976 RepID=A0A518ICD3_9PLAN|nr:C25 family cysteine peptidase [Gimesia fumaroli]QDV50768.1 Gingipain R2 precursor [Gimesia fumaroli]
MRKLVMLDAAGLSDEYDIELLGTEPIVEVEEFEHEIRLSVKFPAFFLIDDSHEVKGKRIPFKQVDIDGVGYLVESGKPLMPSFGRYVQLPAGCGYEVHVKKSEPREFEGIDVLPAQDEITDDADTEHEFEYDESFYKKSRSYPSELVEVTGPFELDAYHAILVHIRPAQYKPKKQKLLLYPNIVVTIRLIEGAGDADLDVYDRNLELESFGNMFVNPQRDIEQRLEGRWLERQPPLSHLTGPQYLIIAHDDFLQAARKLADWKLRKGLITKIVPISDIGNSVSQIKEYVRNQRSKPGSKLRYLLLLGDVDQITTETISGGAFGSNASDYYYTTKFDPAGSTDLVMPSISGGRIPAQSLAEANAVVEQIIRYEKAPPADPEYYRRMTFAGYFQDDQPQDGRADRRYMKTLESIRSHLVSLGFEIERVYVSNNPNPQYFRDGTPVPTEVKAALLNGAVATANLVDATTEGQLITAHRDHGLESGWHMPHFQTGDLSGVTGTMPSIFYSVNCLTGRFDLSASTNSFAEAIMQLPGGAPSLIAATRVSHSFLNDDLTKAIFDGMWPGVLPTFPSSTAAYGVRNNRLGDLLNYAKSYLPICGSGSPQYIKDHFEIYHVIGDPTLEIWKDVPRLIRLRAFIQDTHMHIQLPIVPKGCLITIWHGKRLLKKFEPSSTLVRISLRDLQGRGLPWMERVVQICAAAPGNRFSAVKVRI